MSILFGGHRVISWRICPRMLGCKRDVIQTTSRLVVIIKRWLVNCGASCLWNARDSDVTCRDLVSAILWRTQLAHLICTVAQGASTSVSVDGICSPFASHDLRPAIVGILESTKTVSRVIHRAVILQVRVTVNIGQLKLIANASVSQSLICNSTLRTPLRELFSRRNDSVLWDCLVDGATSHGSAGNWVVISSSQIEVFGKSIFKLSKLFGVDLHVLSDESFHFSCNCSLNLQLLHVRHVSWDRELSEEVAD